MVSSRLTAFRLVLIGLLGLTAANTQASDPSSSRPHSESNGTTSSNSKGWHFLADAERIYIAYNNGVWPDIDYQYKIVFKDAEVTLSHQQMQTLSYDLHAIDECMVKIQGPDYSGYALCERNDFSHELVESGCISTQSDV